MHHVEADSIFINVLTHPYSSRKHLMHYRRAYTHLTTKWRQRCVGQTSPRSVVSYYLTVPGPLCLRAGCQVGSVERPAQRPYHQACIAPRMYAAHKSKKHTDSKVVAVTKCIHRGVLAGRRCIDREYVVASAVVSWLRHRANGSN